MTTKRTHGPCSAECASFRAAQKSSPVPLPGHLAGCPSLYPAQQESDALTRLARLLRGPSGVPLDIKEQALALISEAREEQRRALEAREQNHARANRRERNIGLELALEEIHRAWGAAPSTPEANRLNALFERITTLKDPEP